MTEQDHELLYTVACTVRWLAKMEAHQHPNHAKTYEKKYLIPIEQAISRWLVAKHPKDDQNT